MATYSFLDVVAVLTSPAGTVNLGAGAGVAQEGITIEPNADKNIMTIGADGAAAHSLIANEASLVTVRLLKTSPTNKLLSELYKVTTSSSLLHGKATITVRDIARGDNITLLQVAFRRRPTVTYAQEAGLNEWQFDAGRTITTFGIGTPEV